MRVLEWRAAAEVDLLEIVEYIADDNIEAAQALHDEIRDKAEKLRAHPLLYKAGRVPGTHEMVVRANYVVVYSVTPMSIAILRVLHVAQMWPPVEPGRFNA